MFKKIFLSGAMLTVLLCGCMPAQLSVIKEGQSDYVITCPENANATVKMAVSELKTYIDKATGVKLPVVKPQDVGTRPAFRIGFLEVDTPDAFKVKVMGRDIHISGKDSPGDPCNIHWVGMGWAGTWFGVCDFLEKQLNVRWFFPGEDGEYVPKTANLSIPDNLDYYEKPAMEYRRENYIVNDWKNSRPYVLWLRRNRNGMKDIWCGWHNWLFYFRGKDYFAQHPEWFALVNGRRKGTDAMGMGLQMCTTNSGALDQFAQNLIKKRHVWAKRTSKNVMIPLTPNDGGNFCECAKCTALDNGVRADGSPIMTDRILTYANEVAKRVKKEFPNQKFGLDAYSFYAECVGKVKVDPSIVIMLVQNDTGMAYYRPEFRRKLRKRMDAWKKRVKTLYFYSFPEGMGNSQMPCPHYRNLTMLFKDLHESGITGYNINNSTSFGASGLNNYFYLRFAWGMPQDTEKFYDESLEMCYGKLAAPSVKGYFEDVEKRYCAFANGKSKLSEDLALGYIKRMPGTFVSITPGLAEKWLPPLKQAYAQMTDRGQKARLKLLLDNLEYCAVTTELYQLGSQLVNSTKNDAPKIARAAALADKRLAMIKKMCKLPNNLVYQRVISSDKEHRLPFDPNIFKYMLSQKVRKQAAAERRTTAPVLDGKVDDAFWSGIKPLRIEGDKDNGKVFKHGANARIAITKDALYIGIVCEDPTAAKILDSGRGKKAAVWDENCVDIFIDPAGKAQGYCQLVFNSIGTYRSFKYTVKPRKTQREVDLKPQIATFRGANFWSAEVKIPLRELTAKADCRGDFWGLNICRVRVSCHPSEYSCWSPTFGDFHNPERFGLLLIK